MGPITSRREAPHGPDGLIVMVLRVSRSGNLVHDALWYDFATVLIPTKDAFNYINIFEPGLRCEIREKYNKNTVKTGNDPI